MIIEKWGDGYIARYKNINAVGKTMAEAISLMLASL